MHAVVVEDSDLRIGITLCLQDRGHTVTSCAEVTSEMLEVAWWDGVDAVVTDLLMPGVTGIELILWLIEHAPQVRRIVSTALSEPMLRPEVAEVATLLRKPFRMADLITAVEEER